MELAEGFNTLQKIYAEFIEWGRQLDFAIFRNADFQEFIDISEEMIACPILIYDPALKLLAYSRMYLGLDDHIFQTAISNGYLDLETVKYFEKDKIFNASTCGDNCAKWLLKIAASQDRTINLHHLMEFGEEPFQIRILNTDQVVCSMRELISIAGEFV